MPKNLFFMNFNERKYILTFSQEICYNIHVKKKSYVSVFSKASQWILTCKNCAHWNVCFDFTPKAQYCIWVKIWKKSDSCKVLKFFWWLRFPVPYGKTQWTYVYILDKVW